MHTYRWSKRLWRREAGSSPFRTLHSARLALHPRVVTCASALTIASVALVAAQQPMHGIAGNRLFPGTLSFDDPAAVRR